MTKASWQGFGIDLVDPNKWGDENDPRIIGHDVTAGNEQGGRTAMENLMQKDPGVNVIYTINEPAAAGAYEALKAVGLENQVLVTSVDGGCPGVNNVKDGVIGATSQQYPLLMASKGIEAIATNMPPTARCPPTHPARTSSIPASSWSPTSRSTVCESISVEGGACPLLGLVAICSDVR